MSFKTDVLCWNKKFHKHVDEGRWQTKEIETRKNSAMGVLIVAWVHVSRKWCYHVINASMVAKQQNPSRIQAQTYQNRPPKNCLTLLSDALKKDDATPWIDDESSTP